MLLLLPCSLATEIERGSVAGVALIPRIPVDEFRLVNLANEYVASSLFRGE